MHAPEREAVYRRLEDEMVKYADLIDIPVKPVDEPLVALEDDETLRASLSGLDMQPYTGNRIYVRERAAEMLVAASVRISEELPGGVLEVIYGYRHPDIQERSFNRRKAALAISHPELEGIELLEEIHHFSAVPEVAGHPTGGAADVRILGPDGKPLDMGTETRDYIPDSYTFSPFISDQAKANRMMLRDTMLEAGFAPFDGEWWHYCFGDREWARYYNRPAAIYDQVDFRVDPFDLSVVAR